jgi:quinol monooxygenase YgiN
MGRIVIVGYKPKPGKAETLRSLARTHIQRLRAEGLVTPREAIIMEANDGTIIEVFEWKSKEAIESAHTNLVVQALWKEFSDACDYVPVASIAEAKQLFAEFAPVR